MRIGISGGTFDPVHTGHIESALAAKKALQLDKVIFVPGGEPPHKLDRRITSSPDRFSMLRLAVAPYDGLAVSDFEISRKTYSYSIDTVRHFTEKYGEETELFYIIGADVVGELTYWKDYRELFRLCAFAALMRPGYDRAEFNRNLVRQQKEGARIYPVEGPLIDISSERIRAAVLNGQTEAVVSYLPQGVKEYIEQNGIYQTAYAFDESYARDNMKRRLSPERYEHSLRVAEEAERIGALFGLDREKCRLAGLLHDCGKGVTEHQLHWLAPELLKLADPSCGGSPAIVHGPAGAVIARKKYGIIDSEILEAISCHVTGSPGMGAVAQVVFLADYTEPGRKGASFDRIRQKLVQAEKIPEGLWDAIVAACDESIRFVLSKGQILSPTTLETRNYFMIRGRKHNECERDGR